MDEKRHSFLIVDDDENDRFFITRTLAKVCDRVKVDAVSSCAEAIEFLQGQGKFSERAIEGAPTFIMMDSVLPFEGGIGLVKWIRAVPKYNKSILMVLSGSNDPDMVAAAYASGVNAYLQKPNGLDELSELLKCVCHFWFTCNVLP